MKKVLIAWFAAFLMVFAGVASAAVDLNTATANQLDALKGIGPAKAKAIIDYREKNGPFRNVDDLKHVKGFGMKTIEKLRPELTVDGVSASSPAPVAAPKSIERSEAAKNAFKYDHPCPANGDTKGPCPGYVIDHITPIDCGGADAPANMQWQTQAEGKIKDAWERRGCRSRQ
jgi:competence protein ComEA